MRSDIFRRVTDAPREIEQAVVSLARAVFAAGGVLVFGGHPSISPLISLVAGEYLPVVDGHFLERDVDSRRERRPSGRPTPIVIHQLDAFRPEIPDATMRMALSGQASIVWHETLEGERSKSWALNVPRYPQSLSRMRNEMLGEGAPLANMLSAMVCVGGMEGVVEEALIFHRLVRRPIFAMARTGGATELMAHNRRPGGLAVPDLPFIPIDDEVMGSVSPFLRNEDGEEFEAPARYTPYAAIADEIVRRIADSR